MAPAQRVIVTGGAGFIGSHVCDLLAARGHEVLIVDDLSTGREENLAGIASSPLVRLERQDIRSGDLSDLFTSFAPDAVVHLAAQPSVPVSVADPALDAGINVLGLINVLESALRAKASKVLFASSGGTIYGPLVDEPLRETDGAGVWPESPYGLTKKMAEGYLRLFRRRGLDSVSLALANVFGPRQDPYGESGVVAIFAERLLHGRPCVIYGDGSQTRDFVFVGDVGRAFVDALATTAEAILNIGTGIETTVKEIYDTMASLAGVEAPPIFEPEREGELRRSVLDVSLAKESLDWEPEVSLSDGLSRTLDHFRSAG